MGRLRRGGQGSLYDITQSTNLALANSYDQGRFNPVETGGFFQSMLGGPDPSSQYRGQQANLLGSVQFQNPDFSAYGDPEAFRSQWFLPNQTSSQGSFTPQRQPQFNQQQYGNTVGTGMSQPFQEAISNFLSNSYGPNSGYDFA